MSRMMAGALLFALAACAGAGKQVQQSSAQTQTKDQKAQAKDDGKIICRMERPTGSNIPERVCRYIELQQDLDVQRTQDMMRAAQSHSDPTKGN